MICYELLQVRLLRPNTVAEQSGPSGRIAHLPEKSPLFGIISVLIVSLKVHSLSLSQHSAQQTRDLFSVHSRS